MFYYPIVMVQGFAKERIVCSDGESPAEKKEKGSYHLLKDFQSDLHTNW
jgi:hypothetical protein